MASLGDILGAATGNDSAKQLFLWGILYGLIGSVFDPVTQQISQEVWEAATAGGPGRALSADLLAVMVVRGWIDQDTASVAARKTGIVEADFARMVNNARNPISPEEAAVALRRKIIPDTAAPGVAAFNTAIAEGNLGDQWGPVIQQLATVIPTPADVLQGVLTGQVPAGVDPVDLYTQVGGQAVDPNTGFNWYDFMFNTRGAAPTPNEAAEMARRGIIPWGTPDKPPVIQGPGAVSFYQAFLEGPWRDKWVGPWEGLSVYLPPPRTVTTLLRAGAITVARAQQIYEQSGLTPEDADAYIASATAAKTTAAKNLNEATVEQLYLDKLIDEPTAVQYLAALGYNPGEADLILQSAGLRQTLADLNKNIGRVGSYYIGKHIDQATARTLLAQLQLPAAQIDQLVTGWTIDRSATLQHLSRADIATAVEYGVLTEAEGFTMIEALGYTPFDAWVIMSNRAHAPLPDRPAAGPVPVQ